MSNEITLVIKGAISELPEEDRAKVMEAYEKLKEVVNASGGAGLMALALLGSEAADDE